ncbi:MAG: holin [Lachnospiraceae bacterium]|nr:holin [Lachnospiraceae bacterium]
MKDWKKWAKCAGIRAVKTVAQTAVATIGTATVLNQVDAKLVVSASVLAGILSLLTSVATGLPECSESE